MLTWITNIQHNFLPVIGVTTIVGHGRLLFYLSDGAWTCFTCHQTRFEPTTSMLLGHTVAYTCHESFETFYDPQECAVGPPPIGLRLFAQASTPAQGSHTTTYVLCRTTARTVCLEVNQFGHSASAQLVVVVVVIVVPRKANKPVVTCSKMPLVVPQPPHSSLALGFL